MKLALVVVLVGCGSQPPPAVIGAAPPTPIPQPDASPPPAVAATCAPMADPGIAGSHDRIAFEDPRTHLHGYKDTAGKIQIAATFADASDFTAGGLAWVRLADHSATPYWFIDPTGKHLAMPYLFDNGPDYFQEGFARIVDARTHKMGFIAVDGTIVVPPRYDFAYPFCHGTARTALDGHPGYLDPHGQPTTGPADDDRPLIPPHSDG